MKLLSLFVLIFLFPFCSNKKNKATTLIVCSKAKNKIDSVKVTTYGVNEIFKDLLFNEVKERTVNINAPDNVNGAFNIIIFQKDSIVFSGSFGYYSNGLAIDEKYKINIMEDYTIKEIPNP
jgi:hypothetical protein